MAKWLAFNNFKERNASSEAKDPDACVYVNETNDVPPLAVRQYWDGAAWKPCSEPVPSAYRPDNGGGGGGSGGSDKPPVVSMAQPQPLDFHNPGNKLSAHHRPIGAGAVAAPRGRLANVKRIRCGATKQGRKWCHEVAAGFPTRTITSELGAPTNNKLPFSLKMPVGVEYPSTDGDDVVVLWPRNGGADMCDLFFNFENAKSTAKRRYEYPLGGMDAADGKDGYDRGSSASGMRFPHTVLRGKHINLPSPAPLRQCLNVTATRHSNAGAPKTAHILGKTKLWPAYFMDGSANEAGNNTGDVPYGARLFIRLVDLGLRRTLDLSERGLVLFDNLINHGWYVLDGQGQHEDGGGVLQLRIDQDVTTAVVADLDAQLQKFIPHLYWMVNPRPLDKETEIWTDNLPYAGNGGPLNAGSINTAWDAK